MQRINDSFITTIEKVIPFKGLNVLEIGSGDGRRSAQLAARCEVLISIDPDREKVAEATARQIPNAQFQVGMAQELSFNNQQFDIVLFSLSLHHVPTEEMKLAIDEAIRVLRPSGHLIFVEPSGIGSLFEAEELFGLFPECQETQSAYKAVLSHPQLHQISELLDEVDYLFDSVEDFMKTFSPPKNIDKVEEFLEKNRYRLHAKRRINITRPKLN